MDEAAIGERFELLGELDERGLRVWAAAEATSLGWGGTAAVARATGIAPSTIRRGRAELVSGESLGAGRVRRRGAGRKPLTETDPTLLEDLERLVEGESRGDPERPLRWTAKSLRNLAAELRAQGHLISDRSVAPLLRQLGYSLQANAKTREGTRHPDRDAQFRHINRRSRRHSRPGSRRSRSTPRRKNSSATSRTPGASCVARASPSRYAPTTSATPNWARPPPTVSTTSPTMSAGSTSESTMTPPSSPLSRSAAGGSNSARAATRPPPA